MILVNLYGARERILHRAVALGDRAFWGHFLQVALGVAMVYLLLFVRLREVLAAWTLTDVAGAVVILMAAEGAFRVWGQFRRAEAAAGDGAWRSDEARRSLHSALAYLAIAAVLLGVFLAGRGTPLDGPYPSLRAAAWEAILAATAALLGLWRWNVYRRWLDA